MKFNNGFKVASYLLLQIVFAFALHHALSAGDNALVFTVCLLLTGASLFLKVLLVKSLLNVRRLLAVLFEATISLRISSAIVYALLDNDETIEYINSFVLIVFMASVAAVFFTYPGEAGFGKMPKCFGLAVLYKIAETFLFFIVFSIFSKLSDILADYIAMLICILVFSTLFFTYKLHQAKKGEEILFNAGDAVFVYIGTTILMFSSNKIIGILFILGG
jgi:hypothetical protein